MEITYPLAEAKRSYTINEKDYTAEWRGGTVVELTPPGEPYPIFERKRIDDVPAGPPEPAPARRAKRSSPRPTS